MDQTTEQTSLLVGKEVKFSLQKDNFITGTVMDKILLKDRPDADISITGYVIKDKDSKLHHIAHWRVQSVVTE